MRCWLAASTSPDRGRGPWRRRPGRARRSAPARRGVPLDLAVGLRAGEGAHVGERRHARPRPVELGQLRGGRGHERATQHQHAAARGAVERPDLWRPCRSRSPQTPVRSARSPWCRLLRRRRPLAITSRSAIGLGIRHHDRGTAARRRRPDTPPPPPPHRRLHAPVRAGSRPRQRRPARRPSDRPPTAPGARRRRRGARRVAYSVRSSGTRSPSRSSRCTPPMVTRPAAGNAGHQQQRHAAAHRG